MQCFFLADALGVSDVFDLKIKIAIILRNAIKTGKARKRYTSHPCGGSAVSRPMAVVFQARRQGVLGLNIRKVCSNFLVLYLCRRNLAHQNA
jgi:hypothetical protein